MEKLNEHLRETAVLRTCRGLLNWDQETYMPSGGAELRAKQLALLSGAIHRRQASSELQDLLGAAEEAARDLDPDAPGAASLREVRRDFEQATRIPPELVEEKAHATTFARRAWAQARENDDFSVFLPWLNRIVRIARRYADALGYEDHPYDALIDHYEPGETTASLRALFDPLRDAIVALVGRVLDSGHVVDASCLERNYPVEAQQALAQKAAGAFGFDFARGRLDVTVHPFCGGNGPFDVRITTRYDENNLADGLFSVMHEVGHGIYEQGLASEHFGTPLAEACSLGIHESQSRMWENLVGRSRGFWRWFFPFTQAAFPAALGDVDGEAFYRAVNEVRPSLVRVDADEVTYNLHIFLRFELEQELLTGDLAAEDLPAAWNEKFEQAFRMKPPDDRHGCLQDIHWSAGLYGYFPTYTLGNVYAAQLFAAADQEIGDLEGHFARGEFNPLLRWLNEKIYWQGRRFQPRRLVERATGEPPSAQPLLAQLEAKFGEIYGL